MSLSDWINNAWFIGIVGGVLSGLLVTYLSRYLFSKRDSREYAQKVDLVNKEVIYSIKPGISEGNLPSQEILTSIINATCRKYKVSATDVLNSSGIADELIKEVMDSSFIASAIKIEYCDKLIKLKPPERSLQVVSKTHSLEISKKAISQEIRENLFRQTSSILGITVALITATLTISITLFNNSSIKERLDRLDKVFTDNTFIIPIFIFLIAVLSLILTFFIRDITRVYVNPRLKENSRRKSNAENAAETNDAEYIDVDDELSKDVEASKKK